MNYNNNTIRVEFEEITQPIPIMNIQPETRVLNETCAVISYYGVENRITLVAGCLINKDQGMEMGWGEIHDDSEDYIFHDIIGFSGTKFMVVHARIPQWAVSSKMENRTNTDITERRIASMMKYKKITDSQIHNGLGTIHANLSISVGDIHTIDKKSFGFMDMTRYV